MSNHFHFIVLTLDTDYLDAICKVHNTTSLLVLNYFLLLTHINDFLLITKYNIYIYFTALCSFLFHNSDIYSINYSFSYIDLFCQCCVKWIKLHYKGIMEGNHLNVP